MQQRVSDYIADFLVSKGVKDIFSVVGGGAMYLNDAFGNNKGLTCTYNHHEQASAIAAEGYARINNEIAVVCVTTGPGGTNALTGVLCGYQDNIPMLIISGQVRYNTTVESTGLKLRQFGEQEYTIIESVRPMTKYATMVKDPYEIRYYLEKALYLATSGRKGPCWLDIPLDVQGYIIETDNLRCYEMEENIGNNDIEINTIINEIEKAKRPVILAGSAIRSSGIRAEFIELVKKINIPVVSATSIVDVVNYENDLYFGTFGVFGGRAGNFIVQNADLIIGMGCRMSFKQTGFNFSEFAKNAKKIIIDIDCDELSKDTIKIDIPINADIKDIVSELYNSNVKPFSNRNNWIEYCGNLKNKFPIYQEKHKQSFEVNPYYFIHRFNERIKEDNITVVGNSTSSVCVLQMGTQKENQRVFGNVNCGTMGYDIPASIGAAKASNKEVFCITGDGSMQMNIQELQTIVHNKLPIKIIVFNNNGYQAIVQTQTNFFDGRLSGCTQTSGISMPQLEKIANAYGMPYVLIKTNETVEEGLDKLFSINGYAICEVIQDKNQTIEPKVRSREKEDGTLYSPPIDDLFPFLDEEEYNSCIFKEGDNL
jgi:acetolactate synthase-1/2/3 large subunit